MDVIIDSSRPALKISKIIKAEINCPNCDAKMSFDGNEVDIGNIVLCKECKTKTYYPFEKPWYRHGKLIIGYILSLIVTFLLGLGTNYIYDVIKNIK